MIGSLFFYTTLHIQLNKDLNSIEVLENNCWSQWYTVAV